MATVALCSLKGGTGKTTLSYNLCERAWAEGVPVKLVDFDPQEGSLGLAYLREPEGWGVEAGRVSVAGAEDLGTGKAAYRDGLVVCDLPGSDSMALFRLLMEMDLVLSPVGVGASDLMVAANFASLVKGMGLPVVFVGNNLPVGGARRDEMLEELAGFKVEVCPVMVQRRVAHLDAVRSGLGVCEAFPASAASKEIESLWDWVCGRLGVLRPEKGSANDEQANEARVVVS